MKKAVLIAIPALIYLVVILATPGLIEYISLRHKHNLSKEEVAHSVMIQNKIGNDIAASLGGIVDVSVTSARQFDPAEINRFLLEAEESSKVQMLLAVGRSIGYLNILQSTSKLENSCS